MIAISSFKPFCESQEIARNQIAAFRSWLPVFDSVIFFGSPESCLASSKTTFIWSSRPSIQLLAQMASVVEVPACIINSDIVLGEKAHRVLHETMSKAQAATSFRFDLQTGRRIDNGLDLFIALPEIWRECWPEIPGEFRIGQPVWDSWLNAWLRDRYRMRYMDLSRHKFVFHPKHLKK